MSGVEDLDPVERDADLAWELFDAQPTHPEVGRLASRVLARQPGRNGQRMLLAMHRDACDDRDAARDLFLEVLGSRDQYFVDAARSLRDLEQSEGNYAEARRWAEAVLREEQNHWRDWTDLGAATAMDGDLELGWQILDDAVEQCARLQPDSVHHALTRRALFLLQTFAPAERFLPAAEEAMRADPSCEFVGVPLAWAYVHAGRFDDAEQLGLRLLRQDPTDTLAESVVVMIRRMRSAAEQADITLADFHASGALDGFWTDQRNRILGVDLESALAALDDVMPAELRAALRPPLDEDAARQSPGEREIAAWHDGQEPGTGALWGVDGAFRLMSSEEVAAMDEAIEADPDAHPQWREEEASDYYSQVMTDDAGGYLVVTATDVVIRRAGADDLVVAPRLSDWFWDRVAAFGGRDPRPRTGTQPSPAGPS